MPLAAPKSNLPAAQAAKRQKLLAQHPELVDDTPPAESPTPSPSSIATDAPAPTPAPAAPSPTPAADDVVTLSREEFNRLQGTTDRALRIEQQAESDRLTLLETQHRLTELERTRNETSHAPAPSPAAEIDLGISDADTALSTELVEQFGESEEFVVRLIRRELKALLPKAIKDVIGRVEHVERIATDTTLAVTKTNQRRFVERVMEAVPDAQKLIAHVNFKDFMESRVPNTRLTYNQASVDAHKEEDLEAVKGIFETFRKRYNISAPNGSAYNGSAPEAGGTAPSPIPLKKKYSMADRSKWSEDYRKGRVTYEKFQEFKVDFDRALEAGQVDQ
jgi:hypothetical protein